MAIIPFGQIVPSEMVDNGSIGPFGGIQSELPKSLIEYFGFSDCKNIIFKNGAAVTRPGYTALPVLTGSAEQIIGSAKFYDVAANIHQVVMTPTKVYNWNSGAWTQITGTLSGNTSQLMSTAVVGNKLCFSQGADNVQIWDGITSGFSQAAATAVPGRYLCELGFHLLVGDCQIGGVRATQRVFWTGVGDATDWTSFNAGQNDLFNDLGPLAGIVKLGQNGFGFQIGGITQITPTGVALAPFNFTSMSAHSKGCIAPHSLAAFGENVSFYLGENNVYMFDGYTSSPIGNYPLDGARKYGGARRAIFNDVLQGNLYQICGYISTNVVGQPFYAYWLVIPGVSVWVFNVEETNWTCFTFDKSPTYIANFSKSGAIRFIDLIGSIQQQSWSCSSLSNANPLDSIVVGFSDGTNGILDFSNYSESTWYITSGQCTLGDRKHTKNIVKLRLGVTDIGPATFNVTIKNERGESQTQQIRFNGVGSGDDGYIIVAFQMNAWWIQYTISGTTGNPMSFVEITPIGEQSGELQ
jgi:hypothetical protein